MPFSKIKDPVTPEELMLLQSVFDDVCAAEDVVRDSADGESLALVLVRQLQNGIKDKDSLVSVARNVLVHARS